MPVRGPHRSDRRWGVTYLLRAWLRSRFAPRAELVAALVQRDAELAELRDRIVRHCQTPSGRALHLADQSAAALGECVVALRRGTPTSRREAAVRAERMRAEIVRPWPPVADGRSTIQRATGEGLQ